MLSWVVPAGSKVLPVMRISQHKNENEVVLQRNGILRFIRETVKKVDRYSFWFQIDSNTNEAERLLLNPEFLPKDISRELSEYLGFSKNFGLTVHPVTTNIDKVIPNNERLKMLFKYFILTLLIPFNWIRLKLLSKIKVKFKNILKRKHDWN